MSTGSPGAKTGREPSRRTAMREDWLMFKDIRPWYSLTEAPSMRTTEPGVILLLLPQSLYSHRVRSPLPSCHGSSSNSPKAIDFDSPRIICSRTLCDTISTSISMSRSSDFSSDRRLTFFVGRLDCPPAFGAAGVASDSLLNRRMMERIAS